MRNDEGCNQSNAIVSQIASQIGTKNHFIFIRNKIIVVRMKLDLNTFFYFIQIPNKKL